MTVTVHSFPLFFFNDPPTTEIYTLSLHDALPISFLRPAANPEEEERQRRLHLNQIGRIAEGQIVELVERSEEHTSELQSHSDLVCRLLLEKKKKKRLMERDGN